MCMLYGTCMYQSLNTYLLRGTCVYQRMCLGKVLLFASVQVCLCCDCFARMVFALVIIIHLCLPLEIMRPDCELAHRLIHKSFDESVLRLYKDTSQLDKVRVNSYLN